MPFGSSVIRSSSSDDVSNLECSGPVDRGVHRVTSLIIPRYTFTNGCSIYVCGGAS